MKAKGLLLDNPTLEYHRPTLQYNFRSPRDSEALWCNPGEPQALWGVAKGRDEEELAGLKTPHTIGQSGESVLSGVGEALKTVADTTVSCLLLDTIPEVGIATESLWIPCLSSTFYFIPIKIITVLVM